MALVGIPVRVSAYMSSTVKIFVDPSNIKLEATAKMVPARNVSTVSCNGSTHDSPFSFTKGITASYKKDSSTHNSSRTRSSTEAIKGPYSTTLSGPFKRGT